MLEICWLQLLKCKDFLLFFVFKYSNEESLGFVAVGSAKEAD